MFLTVFFLVIFTSLIENLTRDTATLQNEILTVAISSFLINFMTLICKQAVFLLKFWKNSIFFSRSKMLRN